MASVEELASSTMQYDFIVVGGGTAGCVVASRLAEYLPNKTTVLVEGGPSDLGNDNILYLQRCVNLLGGDLDYDYPIEPQDRGRTKCHHPPIACVILTMWNDQEIVTSV